MQQFLLQKFMKMVNLRYKESVVKNTDTCEMNLPFQKL